MLRRSHQVGKQKQMVTKDIHHEAIEQLDVVLHVVFVGPAPPNVDDVEVVQQHVTVY